MFYIIIVEYFLYKLFEEKYERVIINKEKLLHINRLQ